jgi:nucleotide-binding universal stress UspA family protein
MVGSPGQIIGSRVRRNTEEQLRRQAEQWCSGQIPLVSAEGRQIEIAFGDIPLEIPAAVERYRAYLLVIGRHGARPSSGGFLGSVAEFLLRNGSGPVLAAASAPAKRR